MDINKFNTHDVDPEELFDFLKYDMEEYPETPLWECLDNVQNYGDWYKPNEDTVCGGEDWAIENNHTTEPWVLLRKNGTGRTS